MRPGLSYFHLIMVVAYLAVGAILLFSKWLEEFQGILRYVLGGAFIGYGFYRAYWVWGRNKR